MACPVSSFVHSSFRPSSSLPPSDQASRRQQNTSFEPHGKIRLTAKPKSRVLCLKNNSVGVWAQFARMVTLPPGRNLKNMNDDLVNLMAPILFVPKYATGVGEPTDKCIALPHQTLGHLILTGMFHWSCNST